MCLFILPENKKAWLLPRPKTLSSQENIWVQLQKTKEKAARLGDNFEKSFVLAERVGFEPTVPLPARLFSRQVPSTTRAPLQILNGCPYRYTASRIVHMRTTQRKGDIAVAQAIATFTRMGFDVALPLTESAAYDIIVDDTDNLQRVQVRYSSGKEVDLRRIHSNSKGYVVKKAAADIYDWLYILKPTGEEYLIKECLHSRRSIRPKLEHRLM